MRVETLSNSNRQTQGAQRREWLRQHAPQHLQQCAEIVQRALHLRAPAASRSTVVLGAGACTEVPLAELARQSDEVVLVDYDLSAIQQGGNELESPMLRRKVSLLHCDLSGDISVKLARLLRRQNWPALAVQGAETIFNAAAQCLDECPVPDPPQIGGLVAGDAGLVVSSLVLSQLFSYPILDVLDQAQAVAPSLLGEQERHRRYQEATQRFRMRVINAHLHLMRSLLDVGGVAVLLSDVRGFAFNVHGTDHDSTHRRYLPLVPRTFPDLVRGVFTVNAEQHWDWISDLPGQERPGRGYEVTGYILRTE
ncbi:MAG: hypothetical protein J2P37_03960 [Ktedonobacteraceae bacterium]|nr:hypothetical protein [Ktedonobacteraceae bacterium]MBO0794796.1 hypothetical protein [Ktedonobacteraceae bacterium]